MDKNIMKKEKKLGVLSLSALVISAMICGGVYNLPQNMSQSASAGAIIIAWIITGIGMWFITNTFMILSVAQPNAKTGIYAYAELGFGKFTGFFSAWGYWICNSFANVGFSVLLMDALNYFFPGYFTGGNNILSIIGGSIVLWVLFFLLRAGTKQANIVNIIGTIGKIVPLIIFVLILLVVFKGSLLLTDFWGLHANATIHDVKLGSLTTQIKSTMLVTLWVFTGIEGAVVVSDKAKSQKAVGRATLLGFVVCLLLYAALSILPLGVFPQSQLATMAPPSTAAVLSLVVGKWGGIFMNVGVIIAILTSWLVWTIMLIELPFAAAKKGTFPKIFTKANKNGAPIFSLLLSTIIMETILVLVYFAGNAWNMMLSITGVMVLPCYILSTLYLFKIALKKETYPSFAPAKRHTALITGLLGTIFGFWMLYSAGIEYILISIIIYACGIPVFMKARNEQAPDKAKFTKAELFFVAILIIVAIIAFIYLCMFII